MNLAPSAVIYLALITCGLIWRKNKAIFWVMAGFSILLYAFPEVSPDFLTYRNRYLGYKEISYFTEPLFTLITALAHKLGFSANAYCVLLTIMAWLIPVILIRSLSQWPSAVMAAYMLYSMPVDLVQLRSTLGFGLAIIGLCLYWKSHYKKIWIPILCCVLGMMIHTASILFLLFIPVYWLSKTRYSKWIFVVTFLAEEAMGIAFLKIQAIKTFLAGFFNVGYFLDHALTEGYSIPVFTLKSLFLFASVEILLTLQQSALKGYNQITPVQEKVIEINGFTKLLNLTVLYFVPLYVLGVDLYRLQRATLIVSLIAIFAPFGEIEVKWRKRLISWYVPLAVVSFLGVYYLFFIYSGDYEFALFRFMRTVL